MINSPTARIPKDARERLEKLITIQDCINKIEDIGGNTDDLTEQWSYAVDLWSETFTWIFALALKELDARDMCLKLGGDLIDAD